MEIETAGALTAAQLVQVLGLEKPSVSRMIGKLIKAGELEERADDDGRVKLLQLTERGTSTVAEIHAYGLSKVWTPRVGFMKHLDLI
jgi:DNA-binding MarR family transcriptional regulator